MSKLRETAKQALKAMKYYNGYNGHVRVSDEIEALRQALAEPEQEPVAWRCPTYPDLIETHKAYPDWEPLYTAPQQRQWVGLTDEEVRTAYCGISGKEWAIGGMDDAEPFARAIESKLKEKNYE